MSMTISRRESGGRVVTTNPQAAAWYRRAQRAADPRQAAMALRLAVTADPDFALAAADLEAITGMPGRHPGCHATPQPGLPIEPKSSHLTERTVVRPTRTRDPHSRVLVMAANRVSSPFPTGPCPFYFVATGLAVAWPARPAPC